MLYCTYLTIYHGTKLPIFYLGSTSVQKIQNGYRGSVSSKEYKAIWKQEVKNHPHLFTTKILSTYSTRTQAYDTEHRLHKLLKTHKNLLYTNKSIGGPMSSGVAWNKGLKLTGEKYKKGGRARKGKPGTKWSTKTRKILSGPNAKKALPGELNGMWGKTHTDEVKAGLALIPVIHLKGKTYEEIHGEDRATELKQQRSELLKEYLKNNPGCRTGKNNANAKSYKFVDPIGVEWIVNGNLKIFCKQNALDTGIVIDCVKGRRASYKNWTISYA